MRYHILEFWDEDNYHVSAEANTLENAEKLYDIYLEKCNSSVYKIELYDFLMNKVLKQGRIF